MSAIRVCTKGGHIISGITERRWQEVYWEVVDDDQSWLEIQDGNTKYSVRMSSIEVIAEW